ncbi:peroxidase 19-like [Dorcoceras hygrometricum]|uniref:Peroxidase 19-like n=1 Tax=Dorcoceras hygrometricum TaxID=472368 RepID=A0A2Z7AJ78_9LAMI|nr:peroxidase 19-like [Dorcoceras hygrometricum]
MTNPASASPLFMHRLSTSACEVHPSISTIILDTKTRPDRHIVPNQPLDSELIPMDQPLIEPLHFVKETRRHPDWNSKGMPKLEQLTMSTLEQSGKRKPDQGSQQLDAYDGEAEGCCSERSNQLGRKPAQKRPTKYDEQAGSKQLKIRKEQNKSSSRQTKREE